MSYTQSESRQADLIFCRELASIHFCNKLKNPEHWWKGYKLPHFSLFLETQKFFIDAGFVPYIDKDHAENYASLVESGRWGVKIGLHYEMRIYPAGFDIQFYQNQRHENRNGGKYDSDKYRKMPKLHQALFNKITKTLITFLKKEYQLKFYDRSTLTFPKMTAQQHIIKSHRESSFTRYEMTSLHQIESYMSDYDRNHNSHSGIRDTLKCGQIRRYKDWKGNIKIGIIYHNINNMWWVISSKYEYNNIASFDIYEEVPKPKNLQGVIIK